MPTPPELLENNRHWAESVAQRDPAFFPTLAAQQKPEFFWIGCADSRVPANQIVGLASGEVFVHRNVANLVIHTDLNFLSALQYAVEVLQVRHVIVCGHYGCGGVCAAWDGARFGLIDNWLRHIEDVAERHMGLLRSLEPAAARDRLCELNVIEQARNVARTTIVQDAWRRGQELAIHGWIYALNDGRLRDLQTTIAGIDDIERSPAHAVQMLAG